MRKVRDGIQAGGLREEVAVAVAISGFLQKWRASSISPRPWRSMKGNFNVRSQPVFPDRTSRASWLFWLES
jgi:hypothetical protein